ncbi:MAG TPA: phosphatidylglycerophosphatase A [Chthoniobacteraceae bacterium]|jgi:phosphatidylglycerophosphatase A
MTPNPDAPRKPQLAFAIATSLGLGYLPKAPGTWGSLAGIAIYALTVAFLQGTGAASSSRATVWMASAAAIAIALAAIGVWSADRVSKFAAKKDPQFVVIDEVSGQHLAYALSLAPLNWKYLLLGFILFRAFDIWKPFPARQAESLPGGLGIMADDWAAGLYAALGLWLARHLGM